MRTANAFCANENHLHAILIVEELAIAIVGHNSRCSVIRRTRRTICNGGQSMHGRGGTRLLKHAFMAPMRRTVEGTPFASYTTRVAYQLNCSHTAAFVALIQKLECALEKPGDFVGWIFLLRYARGERECYGA